MRQNVERHKKGVLVLFGMLQQKSVSAAYTLRILIDDMAAATILPLSHWFDNIAITDVWVRG